MITCQSKKNMALIYALGNGHFDIAKSGADVNAVNNEDTTALIMASYAAILK